MGILKDSAQAFASLVGSMTMEPTGVVRPGHSGGLIPECFAYSPEHNLVRKELSF